MRRPLQRILLIEISICNRGPDESAIHVLPILWFRNIWTWWPEEPKPSLKDASERSGAGTIAATDALAKEDDPLEIACSLLIQLTRFEGESGGTAKDLAHRATLDPADLTAYHRV